MIMLHLPARYFRALLAATGLVALIAGQADAEQASSSPLQLELKIFLSDVQGRIDHLAIDLSRKRLFVAELGNGTVDVVDLEGHQVVHTIEGLKEPQGLAYVASTDTLLVANAGDGSVRLFRGSDYEPAGRIDLGDDADNIRVDAASNHVFVGYGNGALTTIDLATNGKIADIQLQAHPESFQLARSTRRIFVNIPKAREIAVIDRFAGKQTASWPVENGSNFPMALDEKSERVLVSFRNPAQLGVFSVRDGNTVATIDACGDADDLFVDEKRQRVYLSCGDGYVDVFEPEDGSYHRTAHIPTISGARTSLFVPDIDRLFVAARANPGEPAAIWVFRPTP
jgi:DNA-binding beta-propeller fold protein YncE